MGKEKQVGTLLGSLLLASVTVGAMYWTAVFAIERDQEYAHTIGLIDSLMYRAYGVESTRGK